MPVTAASAVGGGRGQQRLSTWSRLSRAMAGMESWPLGKHKTPHNEKTKRDTEKEKGDDNWGIRESDTEVTQLRPGP